MQIYPNTFFFLAHLNLSFMYSIYNRTHEGSVWVQQLIFMLRPQSADVPRLRLPPQSRHEC